MISAIVAVNNDWGIGYNGDLLEHIPEDLKYFKALTTGHAVVMGSKTWDSLPKKPLPDRTNIIISHEGNLLLENGAIRLKLEDLDLDYFETDVFVIGGGSIYQQLLPFCDRVYVTKIYKSHEQIDTYFPNLDELDDWASAACGPIQTYKDLTYQFWQYDRI
jgi:dihydrofolate reductase